MLAHNANSSMSYEILCMHAWWTLKDKLYHFDHSSLIHEMWLEFGKLTKLSMSFLLLQLNATFMYYPAQYHYWELIGLLLCSKFCQPCEVKTETMGLMMDTKWEVSLWAWNNLIANEISPTPYKLAWAYTVYAEQLTVCLFWQFSKFQANHQIKFCHFN